MYEVWGQFIEQVGGMWRFRWRALALAWALALAGWVWVYSLPNIYSASARVHVDTESALRPLLRGLAVETNVQDQISFMARTLLSRPQLEKVMRETDLDLRAHTPREVEAIIDQLQRKIGIARDGSSSIYTISFDDADRELAQKVVRTLLDSFVEGSLGQKRTDSSSAQRFLEEQIRDYEQRLAQAEERLADFKKKNVGMMPGEGGDYYSRLQGESDRLQELRTSYRLALERRDQLHNQIEGEEAVFGLTQPSASGPASSLDAKIAEFEAQLADLRLRFTDKHPDILALESTIARLRSQRDKELAASRARASSSGLELNPVYQEMRIALTDAELELTTVRGQLNEQERRVAELRRAVDTIPEVEAQLTRLNRDYDVTKKQYEELLGRLESARLSEQAEETTGDVKFRIVDPPMASVAPVAPNRPVFLTIVLVAAVGAGAGLAFVQNQLAPVFVSRRRLAQLTRVPVLGTVTLVQTPRQQVRERVHAALFGGGVFTLVVAYGLIVLLQDYGVRLAQAVLGGRPL